jgi:NADPH:quinone reductase
MVLAATDCHLEDNLRVAAVKAHLVGISRLGGAVGSLDMEALAFKRVQLTGVTFRTRTIHEKVDVVRALRTDLDLDEAATELRPVVDTVAPWHRIEQLQARMAAGHHLGKMVLEVPTTTS